MKTLAVRNKYLILFLWLGLISASAGWNIYQVEDFKHRLYLETARSFFSLILTTREWNANMGGVYVPVSD